MKIMDILHKLGIVRGGTFSWKGSAKDRPIEAIMDNVYDKEKDLVYNEDFSEKKPKKEISKSPATKEEKRKNKQSKLIFWILLPIGIVLLLAILGAGGFSLWFIVSLFLWFAYLYNIKRSADLGVFSLGKMIGFGIIVIILSFLIVDAAPSNNSKKTNSDKSSKDTKIVTPIKTEEPEEQNDEISLFLKELADATSLNSEKISIEDELLWYGPRISLKLEEPKSILLSDNTASNKNKIALFFESLGWNHGTIGFGYTPQGNSDNGYASGSIEKHKGMMCIIDDENEKFIKVGCGFGPR